MSRVTANHRPNANAIATVLAVLAAFLSAEVVAAPIQAPNMRGRGGRARERNIANARTFKRIARPRLSTKLQNVDLNSQQAKLILAEMPQTERAMHYVAASRAAGHNINFAYRKVKGKMTAKRGSRVPKTTTDKLLVEVTPETQELFRQVMGPNMVWPSGGSNAGHLYTMIADQGSGTNFQMNTYGTSMTECQVRSGKVAGGILLTDKQMSRFVKYTNAGLRHGANKVYGYKMKRGIRDEYGDRMEFADPSCTNWLTAAPIGNKNGSRARSERRDAPRHWSKRPADLNGRDPLAKVIGLSRAHEPGIWMGKLVMAPQVPVLAVMSNSPGSTNLKQLSWGLGQIGTLQANGQVTGGAQR